MKIIEKRIEGRLRDLGDGFQVRRVLPAGGQRMIGPFIFFDHMGPVDFPAGRTIDVRPHPHVALATVTYLFDGEILHRDSLGSRQEIHPGDVNWMVAGRGIVHSERTTPRSLEQPTRMHGIQSWVALPDGHEDDPPAFHHHPQATLPVVHTPEGARLCVIAGEAFGRRSPVVTPWPTLYVDAAMPPGARFELNADHEERAVYVAEGRVHLEDEVLEAGELALLAPGLTIQIHNRGGHTARAMLLGGARFPTPRHVWWNFVGSSPERIERAKLAWAERDRRIFPDVPGDELEFIPLPDIPAGAQVAPSRGAPN
ncbi:MAG: pirin family protein [Sinobacteraceae bacterium]|nr:pirin family protein [Nevskiaceae bacterium]MCP5339256.1 pirin family protein [Nevskiaceae bacterium]MCP5359395.1 pirin family protein [Nevskiaceae bacterium]MCP5467334.1 pirin family protein [Nevskiaceae bacterium]MCP5470834.1 pirin family protein [Nevskiaceae bacterium]